MAARRRGAVPPDPLDWRQTNPNYRESPTRLVVINGVECVEIDGGKYSDQCRAQREACARAKAWSRNGT